MKKIESIKGFCGKTDILTCEEGCIICLGDSIERFWKVIPLGRLVILKNEIFGDRQKFMNPLKGGTFVLETPNIL